MHVNNWIQITPPKLLQTIQSKAKASTSPNQSKTTINYQKINKYIRLISNTKNSQKLVTGLDLEEYMIENRNDDVVMGLKVKK